MPVTRLLVLVKAIYVIHLPVVPLPWPQPPTPITLNETWVRDRKPNEILNCGARPHAARRSVKMVCAHGFPTGFLAAIGHCFQLPVLGSNFKITLPYRKERDALVLFLFSIMRSCNAKPHPAIFYDAKGGRFEKFSAAVSELFVVQ